MMESETKPSRVDLEQSLVHVMLLSNLGHFHAGFLKFLNPYFHLIITPEKLVSNCQTLAPNIQTFSVSDLTALYMFLRPKWGESRRMLISPSTSKTCFANK